MNLRQDIVELMNSTAIGDPTLTTWIYFDQRNLADTPANELIEDELPGLYNRYVHYTIYAKILLPWVNATLSMMLYLLFPFVTVMEHP